MTSLATRVLAMVALGAIFATTPIKAETIDFTGGFRIDRLSNGWCLATAEYANGTTFGIAYGPDPAVARLIVVNAAWQSLVPGKRYEAKMKIGRESLVGAAGRI